MMSCLIYFLDPTSFLLCSIEQGIKFGMALLQLALGYSLIAVLSHLSVKPLNEVC